MIALSKARGQSEDNLHIPSPDERTGNTVCREGRFTGIFSPGGKSGENKKLL